MVPQFKVSSLKLEKQGFYHAGLVVQHIIYFTTTAPQSCSNLGKVKSYLITNENMILILLHSERPKLYTILAFLSAIGLKAETQVLKSVHSIVYF